MNFLNRTQFNNLISQLIHESQLGDDTVITTSDIKEALFNCQFLDLLIDRILEAHHAFVLVCDDKGKVVTGYGELLATISSVPQLKPTYTFNDMGWNDIKWDDIVPKMREGSLMMQTDVGTDHGILPLEFFSQRIQVNGFDLIIILGNDLSSASQSTITKDLQAENRELRKKLLTLQELERKRISADLHDQVNHVIIAIKTEAKLIETGDDISESVRESSAYIAKLADHLMRDIKETINDIKPLALKNSTLIHALTSLCQQRGHSSEQAPDIQFFADGSYADIDDTVAAHIYRVVQESINNAVKYSKGDRITVLLSRGRMRLLGDEGVDCVQVIINDNGEGFDVKASQKNGFGISAMQERAHILGGYFEIKTDKKKGVSIVAQFPAVLQSAVST